MKTKSKLSKSKSPAAGRTEGSQQRVVMPVEVKNGLVKLIALAESMCSTFDDLGNTSMARISAREFAPYYRKKLKRVVKKYGLPLGHNVQAEARRD